MEESAVMLSQSRRAKAARTVVDKYVDLYFKEVVSTI